MKFSIRLALSLSIMALSACREQEADSEPQTPARSASEGSKVVNTRPKVVRRREGRLRSADESRVALVVLPGDARVEIDGAVAERREGLVDLEGKIGDVRRVRVWKGEKTTEKTVTIAENGATPALIDLNVSSPEDTAVGTRKKSTVVEFGFEE